MPCCRDSNRSLEIFDEKKHPLTVSVMMLRNSDSFCLVQSMWPERSSESCTLREKNGLLPASLLMLFVASPVQSNEPLLILVPHLYLFEILSESNDINLFLCETLVSWFPLLFFYFINSCMPSGHLPYNGSVELDFTPLHILAPSSVQNISHCLLQLCSHALCCFKLSMKWWGLFLCPTAREGSGWLLCHRSRAQTHLPLHKDALQLGTANCWVCYRHSGEFEATCFM